MNLKTSREFWALVLSSVFLVIFLYCFTMFSTATVRISKDRSQGMKFKTGSKFELTVENKNNKPGETPEEMVWIPGGEFSMGSNFDDDCLCSIKGVTKGAM